MVSTVKAMQYKPKNTIKCIYIVRLLAKEHLISFTKSNILKLNVNTMLTMAINILALLSNLSICSFTMAMFSFVLLYTLHSPFNPFIETRSNHFAMIKLIWNATIISSKF